MRQNQVGAGGLWNCLTVLIKEISILVLAPSPLRPDLNMAVMLGIRQPFCDHDGKSEPMKWYVGLKFLKSQADASSS